MSQRIIKSSKIGSKVRANRRIYRLSDMPQRATNDTKHRRIAATFQNQSQFEAFIRKLQPAAQGTARELLTPHLSFKLTAQEPVAETPQVP